MVLRFHPEAERELADAGRWYEAARPGQGERLGAELERVLRLIDASPLAGTVWRGGPFRVWPMRVYPYVVAYLPGGEDVVVVALAHVKRRPGYWQHRVP